MLATPSKTLAWQISRYATQLWLFLNRVEREYLLSDHKQGVQRVLQMKELRESIDLTIHDVKPVSDE